MKIYVVARILEIGDDYDYGAQCIILLSMQWGHCFLEARAFHGRKQQFSTLF